MVLQVRCSTPRARQLRWTPGPLRRMAHCTKFDQGRARCMPGRGAMACRRLACHRHATRRCAGNAPPPRLARRLLASYGNARIRTPNGHTRLRPARLERQAGILGLHASSPQSVHALLGYFLRDRRSPTPFPGRDIARQGRAVRLGPGAAARKSHRDARAPAGVAADPGALPAERRGHRTLAQRRHQPARRNGCAPRRTSPTCCSRWRTPTRSSIRSGRAESATRSASPTH